MPVPKKRTSKSKKNTRRSHHRVVAPGVSICSNCSTAKFSHSVCDACGHYDGKQVLEAKANLGLDTDLPAEA